MDESRGAGWIFSKNARGRPATGAFTDSRTKIRGCTASTAEEVRAVMEAWRTERNGGEELKTKDKPIDPVMELLSWCDIKVRIIDPSLKDLGISDECKRHIAGQVLGMLTRHNLKLSREHPSIFLVVESHTLVKDLQKSHFKFQCKIMIFTDQGPKNFAYTLFIPVQNAGSIGKPTGVN